MNYRTRIKYTSQQKAEMWARWQRGESLNAVDRFLLDNMLENLFQTFSPEYILYSSRRYQPTISI